MNETSVSSEGEIASLLVKDRKPSEHGYGLTISTEYGVLALCRIGSLPPHAFVAFEYLTPSYTPGCMDRVIKRLDFRPARIVDCIIGRAKITQDDVGTSDCLRAKVGPLWRLKTEDVLKVAGFKDYLTDGTDGSTTMRVTDMESEIYSSAGNSVKPFLRIFNIKVNNCMTFSREFLITCSQQLGISETTEELDKMMNLKWLPIQLPNILVPYYKKHQCRSQ